MRYLTRPNTNAAFATQQQQEGLWWKYLMTILFIAKTTPSSFPTWNKREMEIMKGQRVHKVCQHVMSLFSAIFLFIIIILLLLFH